MIIEGTVNEVGVTSKGTPKVKIGGQWYFGGRGVQLNDLKPGLKVGVEYGTFGEKNDMRAIKSWALLPHQPAQGTVQTAIQAGMDQSMEQRKPTSEPPTLNMSEGERLCVSNWIGQAIAAGAIKMPGELLPWILASRAALKGKGVDPDEEITF